MVKVQRLFAKTNLKIQVCRTDKIPLGTKGRTTLCREQCALRSFIPGQQKKTARPSMFRHFVPSRWLHPLATLVRLSLVDLPSANSMKCCSPPASLEKQIPKIRPFGHKKIPLKQFGYLPCLLQGGSYHIWRVCLFCCGIRRKRVEGTEVIIGDLHGAFFAAPCPLQLQGNAD